MNEWNDLRAAKRRWRNSWAHGTTTPQDPDCVTRREQKETRKRTETTETDLLRKLPTDWGSRSDRPTALPRHTQRCMASAALARSRWRHRGNLLRRPVLTGCRSKCSCAWQTRFFCKKTVCCVMNVKSRLVRRYKVETDERDQSLYTARQRGQ